MSEIKTYFDSFPSTVALKVYVKDKTEFFELVPDEGEVTAAPLKTFSQELGQSAVDFLYAPEREVITERLLHSESLVRKIKENPKNEAAWKDFFEMAKLAERHPFYLFLLCRIVNAYKNGMKSETGSFLQDDYFEKIGKSYQNLMLTIQEMVEECFNVTEDNISGRERYLESRIGKSKPICISNLHVEPIPETPYKEGSEGRYTIGDVLRPVQPEEIGQFLYRRYLQEEIQYKRCEYCKQYFVHCSRGKAKYCNREFQKTGKSCKQLAFKTVRSKVKENPIEKKHERTYKKYYARMLSGHISKEEFGKWSQEARKLRDECKQGIITFEAFSKWLDESLTK